MVKQHVTSEESKYSSVSKLSVFNQSRQESYGAYRPRPAAQLLSVQYIRARGAGPPEAIGEAGGRPRNRLSHPAAQ